MPSNFGTGVSRVLSPDQTSYVQVIWQQGKPPLDSELNLLQQIDDDWRRTHVLLGTPSGFLGNATSAQDSFDTQGNRSNWFKFGLQRAGDQKAIEWAVVNGWLIPVTGTLTGSPPGSPNDTDTWNRITLDPPPANSGDTRIDFVFLEVWQARIPPNPSTSNKPSASGVYRYGNVEGGYSFLPDHLQDPAIGFETTQRVQLQYRIRVVSGLVGLASYPDGFDPTVVKARGAATANTAFVFENMREELGDPGLWRAGDGTQNALGTVDGYVYAIPICAVFRRNTVSWDGDPSQNLNGGFNRNPTAVDRTGFKTFTGPPSLTADITATTTSITLDSISGVPTPLTPATPVFVLIDDEYLTYSVITGTTMTLASRGALGSKAESHRAGANVSVVSGRPDKLFADQVALTDILDLRHAVNPNGFDADTVLQANLDKLLRGELRANWKRSGGGPQGTFVLYQDKVSTSPASIGVTKLDGPDGIREVFSDAAMLQQIEVILTPPVGVGPTQTVTTSWGLSLTATDASNLAGNFQAGDLITIPVAQFKNGISGSDADQIRFLGPDDVGGDLSVVVKVRVDGDNFFLTENDQYSLLNATMTSTTDMQIRLLAGIPSNPVPWPTTRRIFVTVHVLYGPGRGLSRRPDSVHSVAYLSSGADIMTQLAGVPSDNTPVRTAWAPLWSKFRKNAFGRLLPVTAEAFVDPGSKTLILTPFRRIDMPDTIRTLDGTSVNLYNDSFTNSLGTSTGTTLFTDTLAAFTGFVFPGDVLVINDNSSSAGRYRIVSVPTNTTLILERTIDGGAHTYQIFHAVSLMPIVDGDGNPKWTTTDPLQLFRGTTWSDTARKNIYLPIPRHLVPSWGEVRVPILHTDTATFDEGVNFMVLSKKGSPPKTNAERNYVPYSNGSLTYAPFSTLNLNTTSTPATYNAAFTFGGNTFAGMRFFNDPRNMGRHGLELPPFYGISRLFAVYEAVDYKTNGSAYNPTSREFQSGGATNLLRQNFDGSTFWIELDSDGDSTFILNANAIDISKSPNTLTSFAAGNYVIEANIFGFDRGSFDSSRVEPFRLVLTREVVPLDPTQAGNVSRPSNVGTGSAAAVSSPTLVVPGPTLSSDEVAINYSRTVYQGDAWGSQTAYQDIGYTPGPLTSGTASQVANTNLNGGNLTRPNQKVLEVLSSIAFATTLGSGRLSGDFNEEVKMDFRNIGWEDPFQAGAKYPPGSGITPRPAIQLGGLIEGEGTVLTLGTSYHGCTERLPLGALYRDKDFRGGFVGGFGNSDFAVNDIGSLLFIKNRTPGLIASGVSVTQELEQFEIPVNTNSIASGQPGELIVHVDGEQGNYGLLTNFRTLRGGSVFSACSPRPGGELQSTLLVAGPHAAAGRVLAGVAMLVRNTVTDVGSNEVSAGSELMMLVVTTVTQLNANGAYVMVLMGTNGTAEGLSAADLYHCEGRPLMRDNVRIDIDPSAIDLGPQIDTPGAL